MAWQIEYTNHPWLKKKLKIVLERAIAESVGEVKHLLESRMDGGFTLGETGFYVESVWLPDLKKHHITVRDLKRADDWVASIVFDNYPTMGVEEVKNTLKNMGFGEYSLYALGVTNEKAVGDMLKKIQEDLKGTVEEGAQKILLVNKAFLETFLEKGLIKMSDGLLDALRKIEASVER
jgi:hypothetical protein